jgi:hypothetical protein
MIKAIRMNTKRMVTLDGMMTYGKLFNGLIVVDFKNYDPEVEVEPVAGRFKGRLMHDGNLYLEQLPRRIRNKPKYRQDHSSVSIGRNGKGYFVMVVDEAELDAFPQILVREANEAAAKMYGMRKQA